MGTSITSSDTGFVIVCTIYKFDVRCIRHEESFGGFYGRGLMVLYKVWHLNLHPSSFVLTGVIWAGSPLPDHPSLSFFVFHTFLCSETFWRECQIHCKTLINTEKTIYQNLHRKNPVSMLGFELKTLSI